MICPFCEYERVKEDVNPEWECPNCKKAYCKYQKFEEGKKEFKFSYGEFKDSLTGVLTVFTLVSIWELYNLYTLLSFGTIEFCGSSGQGCIDLSFKDSPIGFCFFISFHIWLAFASFILLYNRLFKK